MNARSYQLILCITFDNGKVSTNVYIRIDCISGNNKIDIMFTKL